MSVLEVDLSALFVVAVIVIWFMIGYQFVLTVFGYVNFLKSMREQRRPRRADAELPDCTILIPAHNEGRVIRRTLGAMCALDYPADKLRIVVVDDGSTDDTGAIVGEIAGQDARVVRLDVPIGEGGRGKSRALNLALREVQSGVLAVYDADNTPSPGALRALVSALVDDPSLGAAIGKFRTVNKNVNLLTRFINIETLGFQSMLQAGRWQMHNIATLPGTNFAVRTSLMRALGGWDEQALTEDAELSIRIYEAGHKIKFVPYAVTYEQEPQSWGVWVRQRTRWVRGNNYVVGKFLRRLPRFRNRRLAFDLLYTLSLYYVFFVAILISDALFLLSATSVVSIALPGPYTAVWILAVVLFALEILLAISYDGEDRPGNLALIMLMYFTYCQFWIYVVLRALYIDFVQGRQRRWDKTERFDVQPERGAA